MRRTRSGEIAAPPMPHTRTSEKSVRARSGWARTSSHCVGTPVPIVMRSSRMSRKRLGCRPRLAGEHDRRAVRELVPHPGHVADVREGQHDEPAIAGLGELAHVARDRGHALVVVDRALRRAGGAARPDDARGIGGLDHRQVRVGSGLASERGAELGDVEHRCRGSRRPGSRRRRRGRSPPGRCGRRCSSAR